AWIAKKSRISQAHVRRLIACGVAAGVAASFNAPIAGTVFAIEVVVGKYTLHTFAPIAISTVVGTSVSRLYFGAEPAFSIPSHAATALNEIPVYALLGIVSALITMMFLLAVALTETSFERLRLPARLRPAVGGLFVGLIALYTPQVLGVGYETTNAALQESLPLALLRILIATKIAATGICLGSGFGGGVFSPSLFIGAVSGGAFGALWQSYASGSASGYSAFTVVGMGAVVAATLGAPLSTTLIVFEMTGDYPLTLAVMVAAITSSILVNDVWGRSFFSWQLQSRGVDLTRSQTERLMSNVRVDHLMNREFAKIADDADRAQAADALRRGEPVYVVDEHGAYRGALTHTELNGMTGDTATAGSAARAWQALHESDSLAAAMTLVKGSRQMSIPVLADDEHGRLVGHVSPATLLDAYRGVLDRVAREERSFDS
ncbi:MAG TPA: chloride channel protein, partial [Woeseiaceae bacterium]|nr:chloride channel protein [Woeseiaceae bacterium]